MASACSFPQNYEPELVQSNQASVEPDCGGNRPEIHCEWQQKLVACEQAQASLEAVLHTLIELIPLPVMVTNLENDQILLRTPLIEPWLELADSQTIAQFGAAFYADPASHTDMISRLQSGETLTDYELQLKRTGGEVFEAQVSAVPVNYKGTQAAILVFSDRSQLAETQPAKAKPVETQPVETQPVETNSGNREDRFRMIVDAAPIPLTISHVADGTVVYANQQVGSTFGLPTEALLGRQTSDFYATVDDRQAMLERLLPDGYVPYLEVPARKADGTPFWVAVSLRLLTLEHEPYILSAFYDITPRKQAEESARTSARQQAAVAELGQRALAGSDLTHLMNDAATLISEVLGVEYAGIWKRLPSGNTLLLEAGVGWQAGLVGSALVGTQAGSQLGYTLLAQQPVLIEDLRIDIQFNGPPLLHNHRVVSGMSVIIAGQDEPFGVLSSHTTRLRPLTQDDIHFLQAIANVLATAIDRQDSEARLYLMERAIAASSNGIVLTDANQPDNPVIYANPAFEAMTGYPVEEVIGRNCRFLQGVNTDPSVLNELRTALQEQRDCHITVQNYRKDGTPFWNELYVAPVFDAEGYLTHFVGIQTDITERKCAEETLRDQEEQYRRIVETATEGIWVLDKDNTTSFVNQQMATMLGYQIEEMIGKPLFAFMDAEGIAIANAYLERRRQGIHEAHDFKFRRQDGSSVWAIISTAPLFDADNQYAGALGMLTDVTDRKQAEAALRLSEQRLDSILGSLQDVVWSVSASSGEVLYLNPASEKVYGYPIADFFANSELWFEIIHPDDQERVRSAVLTLRQTGSSEIQYRIIRRDGEVRWLDNRSHVTQDANGQAIRLDGIVSDITEHKRMEDQLARDAFYDALTGLPNRLLFMDRLRHAIAQTQRLSNQQFAVLFLDLDRFKLINDSLGHLAGDNLLIAIARRLEACLRSGDTVARLGGDEFTILLDGINSLTDATMVAERIHRVLQSPLNLNGYDVFTTVSIGIALSTTGYDEPDAVLRDADTALYQAKARGKACYAVFDTVMYDQAVMQLQLETDLRWAIERQELRVYYQPIVSLITGRITGFEALVRWQHPDRGLISPTHFIPVAEETGLIVPIGQWVLQESCQQIRRWQEQFLVPDLTINVNLSSKQFSQPNLVEQIQHSLQATGLNASHLKLEITESGIMENTQAATMLDRLRTLGVQLCIDDFGTGYSSLSRLHQFPINTLKIDRAFVSTMSQERQNAEIVQAIITLAHQLSMDLVAEGVATGEQLAQLRQLHCEQGQGYFFSEPLTHQAAAWLLAQAPQWIDP